jgi:hypothetical protein
MKIILPCTSVFNFFISEQATVLFCRLSLDKIQRMGQWANSVLEKTYLLFFTPDMVLAAGGHLGVAENYYQLFWEPRYQTPVPPDFVEYVYPFIGKLEAAADRMEAKKLKIPSVRAIILSLKYMATVLWQDTLDMAFTEVCFDENSEVRNPCIIKVMQHPEFQKELVHYKFMMDSKVSYLRYSCF